MTQLTIVNNLPELADLTDLSNQIGGLVQVRQSLLKPLVIKLNQSNSKMVTSETAKIGDFTCEVSGTNFGKTLSFIPIMVRESASLLYTDQKPPRNLPNNHGFRDGTPICYSKDLIRNKDGVLCKNCPYGEYWATWDKTPSGKSEHSKCHESIDIFCIPEGMNQVALLQMRKTSYRAGQDLVNKITRSGLPPFLSKYTFKTKDEKNESDKRYKAIDKDATTSEPLSKEELLKYSDTIREFLMAQKNNEVQYDVVDSSEKSELEMEVDNLPI